MGTNGFGFPVTVTGAGGFMGIMSAVAGGIGRTPAPAIGTIVIIVITIAVMTIVVMTMIGTTTVAGIAIAVGIAMMIGAGIAIKNGKASNRWRSRPAEGVMGGPASLGRAG